jgi:hypothetical protein
MLYADWQLNSCQNSARLSCQLAIVIEARGGYDLAHHVAFTLPMSALRVHINPPTQSRSHRPGESVSQTWATISMSSSCPESWRGISIGRAHKDHI